MSGSSPDATVIFKLCWCFSYSSFPIFQFKKRQRQIFYRGYSTIYWSLSTDVFVNDFILHFYDKIMYVFMKHIFLKTPARKCFWPWFNVEIINLLKKKNQTWKVYKKSKLYVDYDHLRKFYKKMILNNSTRSTVENIWDKYPQ